MPRSGPPEWRCFHCDEVFTDEAEAREHFGADESKVPACRLSVSDVRQLRALEALNAKLRREVELLDNDARLYYELRAEVNRRTNGHGLFMHLDYLEGEKIVLQERIKELEAAAVPRSGQEEMK